MARAMRRYEVETEWHEVETGIRARLPIVVGRGGRRFDERRGALRDSVRLPRGSPWQTPTWRQSARMRGP